MIKEELMKRVSQTKDTHIKAIEDLQAIYDNNSCAEKLKRCIGKVIDFKERRDAMQTSENLSTVKSREELNSIQDGLGDLQEILISFGGVGIAPVRDSYIEDDLKEILERGQVWLNYGFETMKGKTGKCHRNASNLWDANKDNNVYLATGYALSEDGLWYCHSWGLHKKPRSVSVVETTSPKRILYYGFVMTNEEAEDFYQNN